MTRAAAWPILTAESGLTRYLEEMPRWRQASMTFSRLCKGTRICMPLPTFGDLLLAPIIWRKMMMTHTAAKSQQPSA